MRLDELMTQSTYIDGKDTVSMVGGRVYIGDRLLPALPKKRKYQHMSQHNNRLYVNGFEYDFKKERWKRTIRSFLTNIF